jgi:hypothetical protein
MSSEKVIIVPSLGYATNQNLALYRDPVSQSAHREHAKSRLLCDEMACVHPSPLRRGIVVSKSKNAIGGRVGAAAAGSAGGERAAAAAVA